MSPASFSFPFHPFSLDDRNYSKIRAYRVFLYRVSHRITWWIKMETKGGKRGTIAQGLWPRFIIHFVDLISIATAVELNPDFACEIFANIRERKKKGRRRKRREKERKVGEKVDRKVDGLWRGARWNLFFIRQHRAASKGARSRVPWCNAIVLLYEQKGLSTWNIVPGVRTMVFSNRLKSDLLRNS